MSGRSADAIRRLLAYLFLIFLAVAVGSQALRRVLPNGRFKSTTISHRVGGVTGTTGTGVGRAAVAGVALAGAARQPPPTVKDSGTGGQAAPPGRSAAAPDPSAAAPGRCAGALPSHFPTLPPGASLPSGSLCARWVRAKPLPERKPINRGFNQAPGHHVSRASSTPGANDLRADTVIAARIDGAFTGTTQEILRWAACQWGIDEDLVNAQARRELVAPGLGLHPAACVPGYGLGTDGRPGQCPQSFGILQNHHPFERSTWPGIERSTAMNADTA